jgi:hypothetical protein
MSSEKIELSGAFNSSSSLEQMRSKIWLKHETYCGIFARSNNYGTREAAIAS